MIPPVKRAITKDWAKAFPGMGIYGPMWLMRRIGPLVTGICLNRTGANDAYRPTYHFENLSVLRDYVPFLICTPLRLRPEDTECTIRAMWHENNVERATRRMAEMARLPVEGPVAVADVITAFEKLFEEEPRMKAGLDCYEIMIAACSWCGQTDKALEFLNAGQDAMASWSPMHLDQEVSWRSFDPGEWVEEQRILATTPSLVRERVEARLAMDPKLAKLPYVDLDSS